MTEWNEALLVQRGVRPAFAKVLAEIPALPSIDVVSDQDALSAVRSMLDNADSAVVIPKEIAVEKRTLRNNCTACIVQQRGGQSVQRPIIFLIGGGGFVAGSAAMMVGTASELCKDLDAVCVCLSYRHAPEHPFPAALIDVLDGMDYFIEHASKFNIDTHKISVYGQSAGGDLAVLACVAWHNKDHISSLVLSSPCSPQLGAFSVGEKDVEQSVDWCWNVASHRSALKAYQQGSPNEKFPYLHSSCVPEDRLSALPPTHVFVAEHDFLRKEALSLAQKLMDAGVPTSVEVRRGDVHIGLDLFFSHPEGLQSRRAVTQHFRETMAIRSQETLPEIKLPDLQTVPKFPIDVTATSVTDIVKQYNSQSNNGRLREIIACLVEHLHDFTRSVRLTREEWMTGIQFLTKTGQTCTDVRQEFILLSDVLGLSVLVDCINQSRSEGATPSTVLGPFFTTDAPDISLGQSIVSDQKAQEGIPMLVRGRILDIHGAGIPGATIETWETDASGHYDTQYSSRDQADCRGRLQSVDEGKFQFKAIVPVPYPIPSDGPVGELLCTLNRHVFRPAHLHMMIESPDFETLVTALYFEGDPFLHSDAVLGVKEKLVCKIRHINDAKEATSMGFHTTPCALLEYDFVLTHRSL